MRNVGCSGRRARALTAARTQAEHAAAVISRVREFVRAREPHRDAQDIAAIAGTVVELLRLEAERLQLRIDLALAPQLPAVHADRVMVEQVLLNLVKNAIEAMREIPAARRELRIEGRTTLDGEVEHGVWISDGERVRVEEDDLRELGLLPHVELGEEIFPPALDAFHGGVPF